MAHPAKIARGHVADGLEACQADPAFAGRFERLAGHLAQAQGKLFPASKLDADSAAAVDLMRRAMDHLAQALKVLQEVRGGAALTRAAASIALALKTLHPVVQTAKETARRLSTTPPPRAAGEPPSNAVSVNINTMLNLSSDHQFYNGFSENIEEGGIFVATFDPKPVNASVVVNFKLPGDVPVTAQGVVQFVREYNPLTPETPPGMGVKFTVLAESAKRDIEQYLKRRAPMFYEDP